MPVRLTIPEHLYDRARRLAREQERDVEGVIIGLLDEMLPPEGDSDDLSAPDAAVEREMRAYIAMHPVLKEKCLGKHVAIYRGELVDHDDDYDALYARIEEGYPDEFVWLTTVEEEPLRTLLYRSPRLVQGE